MAASAISMHSCLTSSPMAGLISRSPSSSLPPVYLPHLQQRSGALRIRCQAEDGTTEKEATPPPTRPPFATPPPAPKVSTKFTDIFAFSGPAPERINGRLAMVGFVAALAVELVRGDDLLAQLMNGGVTWFVVTSVLISAASLVPLFQGVSPQAKSDGVMSPDAELWNGRFAMLGLVSLALTEYFKGGPLV